MSDTFEMIVKITGNLRKHGMYIKNQYYYLQKIIH